MHREKSVDSTNSSAPLRRASLARVFPRAGVLYSGFLSRLVQSHDQGQGREHHRQQCIVVDGKWNKARSERQR